MDSDAFQRPSLMFRKSHRSTSEADKGTAEKDTEINESQAAGKTKVYNGKVTAYVVCACIVAASGGALYGYDKGIAGGVSGMDPFLQKFYPQVYANNQQMASDNAAGDSNMYCNYNNYDLQWFSSSLWLAGAFFCIPAGYIARRWGRIRAMLIAGIAFAIGSILQAAAENVAMLISGRVLLGVGVAFAGVSVPLYNSEMAPPHLRGSLSQLWQLVLTLGLLVAQLVNVGTTKIAAGWGWRLSLGLGVVPAIALILGGIFLPETPNSLIERGQVEEGHRVLKKIRGSEDVDDELSDIIEKADKARTVTNPWGAIIKRKFRPQLVLCFTTMIFQMWTGVDFVTAQAPLVLTTLGYSSSDALNASIGVGALIFVSTLLAIWLADKHGRKVLLFIGGVMMTIPLVGITIVLALYGASADWIAPFCLTMVYIFTVAFGATWGPIGWLYVTEILTLETRTAGQAISTVVNMLLGWLIAQFFLTMLCSMEWGVFVMFSVSIAVITVATQLIYPETAGVPIEECPLLFKEHWVWKRYANDNEDDKKPASGTLSC